MTIGAYGSYISSAGCSIGGFGGNVTVGSSSDILFPTYLRPDGSSFYFRPDGSSLFARPI